MWHIGQRIVCIAPANQCHYHYKDGTSVPAKMGPHTVVVGNVYTIRAAFKYPDGYMGFWLEEVSNPPGRIGEETFHEHCFRPVKDTNIDIFLEMLKPVKEDA